MKGTAYVFLRKDGAPLPPGCAGHVGWGFRLDNGAYMCGATENRTGAPLVPPGGDNDAWAKKTRAEAEMLGLMRRGGYDGYKLMTVSNADPNAAEGVVMKIPGWGYRAIGSNCLDHAYAVLEAYGEQGMPWMQTHPSPNDWFGVLNGEYRNL